MLSQPALFPWVLAVSLWGSVCGVFVFVAWDANLSQEVGPFTDWRIAWRWDRFLIHHRPWDLIRLDSVNLFEWNQRDEFHDKHFDFDPKWNTRGIFMSFCSRGVFLTWKPVRPHFLNKQKIRYSPDKGIRGFKNNNIQSRKSGFEDSYYFKSKLHIDSCTLPSLIFFCNYVWQKLNRIGSD